MSERQPATRDDVAVLRKHWRWHVEMACNVGLADDEEIHNQIRAANTYARLIEMLRQNERRDEV